MKYFNLPDIPKDFNSLVFGRQLPYFADIKKFKEDSKTFHNHFSRKRKTFASGLKEFRKLYNVDKYYCVDTEKSDYCDDSVEIWYTKKE